MFALLIAAFRARVRCRVDGRARVPRVVECLSRWCGWGTVRSRLWGLRLRMLRLPFRHPASELLAWDALGDESSQESISGVLDASCRALV